MNLHVSHLAHANNSTLHAHTCATYQHALFKRLPCCLFFLFVNFKQIRSSDHTQAYTQTGTSNSTHLTFHINGALTMACRPNASASEGQSLTQAKTAQRTQTPQDSQTASEGNRNRNTYVTRNNIPHERSTPCHTSMYIFGYVRMTLTWPDVGLTWVDEI